MSLAATLSNALSDRYRIERELGAGGMATVYLAEDVRHRRRVAVKVLHPELSAVVGPERFLKEIELTASLQHPHILPLFDSGNVDGQLFYVMPFVEGETLRARLEREGQLSIEDTVRIATQVADALEYAHRHGIVHRDVKPENVLLHDGHAMVADFGIALAVRNAGGDRLTMSGISLGTPQYMAPEQAVGERTVDARADVYALAAVTYEMFAGEPPFTGPTAQAIITRLMTEHPRALTATRPSVTPGVEAVVLKGLERLPADRYASAAEFARALRTPSAIVAASPILARRSMAMWTLATIGIAGIALAWIAGARFAERRATLPPPSRLALLTPRLVTAGQVMLQRQIAITPDGSTLLYVVVGSDGLPHLVKQPLADPQPTMIAGVRPGLAAPIVSADGRSFIAMAAGERQAYRYPLDGGPGLPLSFPGGSSDFTDWDDRGTIWSTPRTGTGIFRLGQGDSVGRPIARSGALRLEQMLPGGRYAIVETQGTMQSSQPAVFDVETGELTPLGSDAVQEIHYAAGHLVYVLANGTLESAPFDADKRKLTGPAAVIATDVSISGAGVAQLALARNGTIAYIAEEPQSLVLVDRAGAARPVIADRHNYHGPRFSPDGTRIAVDFTSESGRDVWVSSVSDGTLTRATFAGDGHDAAWAPDGRFITYLSTKSNGERIYRKRWSGSDAPDTLFSSPALGYTGIWLHDGSGIVTVINDLRGNSGADIAFIENGGRGPARPLVASEFSESYPAVSPNGKWLAFASDQSGHLEVYAQSMTGDGDRVQISAGGGSEPNWSPDGSEVFYRTLGEPEPKLMSATVRTAPSLAVTARRPLFTIADIVATQPHVGYDVSPDGKAFVMVKRTPAQRIVVLQDLLTKP
jgi:serine/threonine-protein kinase